VNKGNEFMSHVTQDRRLFSTPDAGSVSGLTGWSLTAFNGFNHTHGEDPVSDQYQTLPSVGNYGGASGLLTLSFAGARATASDNGGVFGGITTATSTTGTTITHSHLLEPGIFETSLPARVGLWIDNGGGALVDVSPSLGGPWTASMAQSVDITGIVEQSAGKTVRFEVRPVIVAGNPTGLCEVELSGFGVVEMSQVGSEILAG
jgi:hypothetical protein